jgi:hypothetical protein
MSLTKAQSDRPTIKVLAIPSVAQPSRCWHPANRSAITATTPLVVHQSELQRSLFHSLERLGLHRRRSSQSVSEKNTESPNESTENKR